MAFISNMTSSSGRTLENAYCRAHVHMATKLDTVVVVQVWQDASDRAEHPSNHLAEYERQFIVPMQDIQSKNPLEYAYLLLKASGKFPDAVWNI